MVLLAVKTKGKSPATREAERNTRTGEAVVYCPNCKALQTVWFNEGTMVPTRKFSQDAEGIYHDCSASQPCRVYQSW